MVGQDTKAKEKQVIRVFDPTYIRYMLLEQVISKNTPSPYHVIGERCSTFISESKRLPLLKNLPTSYSDVHKVKARKRNVQGEFATTLNQAFEGYFNGIAQRAIFANGDASFQISEDSSFEPFFVFPINGYKYMYSAEVYNSNKDYQDVLDVMFQQFGSDKGKTIVTEVLKFAYEHENLAEGISKGSEIIIYNIPFYYAVRCSTVADYASLLDSMASHK